MTQVDAVFQGGVFKPLGEVRLADNQKVRLNIEPVSPAEVEAWLAELEQVQQAILDRRGGQPLPDSTPDIAEDRLRDL